MLHALTILINCIKQLKNKIPINFRYPKPSIKIHNIIHNSVILVHNLVKMDIENNFSSLPINITPILESGRM